MLEKLRAKLSILKAFLKTIHVKACASASRFIYDTRAEGSLTKFVLEGVGIVIAVMMLPPVADTVIGVNTSAWTFTGADACKTMMYLIPFIYIVAVIVHIVKSAIE